MVLVDTSVWIEYFRSGNQALATLLGRAGVLTHPFIIGELSLGSLQQRATLLHLLSGLPQARIAQHDEVLHLINTRHLFGIGIGYVDVHLLAAAQLTPDCTLWTLDKRLQAAADGMGLGGQMAH
jgi:predicted nucleic acid-binding protein